MKIKVKTLWINRVAIRDKQLKEIWKNKDKIVIEHDKKTMTIEYKDIKDAIKGKSEMAFKDRFSNEEHYLFYFDWKPDLNPQQSLFSEQ